MNRLGGAGLAHWVSEWWLLLMVFVGVNLIQSVLTGFCPAEIILKKLGVGKSCEANPAIQPSLAK